MQTTTCRKVNEKNGEVASLHSYLSFEILLTKDCRNLFARKEEWKKLFYHARTNTKPILSKQSIVEDSQMDGQSALFNRKWTFVSLYNSKTASGLSCQIKQQMTLFFRSDKTISIGTPCNQGTAELRDCKCTMTNQGTASIKWKMFTQKACGRDPNVLFGEQVMQSLPWSFHWSVNGNTLMFEGWIFTDAPLQTFPLADHKPPSCSFCTIL